MANFLAYFDLLGYKKFIENNDDEHLDGRTNHFARNIEMALALDQPNVAGKHPGAYLPDISQSTLHCLTFSDTVVLWTNSNTLQEFEEMLRVAYEYNRFNILHDFPSRGCIVYGDIRFKPFDSENMRGGRYMLNMIYGKALIDAHLRAEAMSWAGCELDISAIEFAKQLGDISPLLEKYTMQYDIPFKSGGTEIRCTGYTLRLFQGAILITQHYEKGVASAFTQDNKGKIEGRTKVIYDNTIEYLRAHQIKFPYYYFLGGKKNGTAIWGKLDAEFRHTTVTLHRDGLYEVKILVFDPQKDDRDFLEGEIIPSKAFEEVLEKSKSS